MKKLSAKKKPVPAARRVGRPANANGTLPTAIYFRPSSEVLKELDARVAAKQRVNLSYTRADLMRELLHEILSKPTAST